MFQGPVRLAILAGLMATGATGATMAVVGLGVPYLLASTLAGVAAGIVMYAALRAQPPPDRSAEMALRRQLDDYRVHTSALRHDLRGVLSPALMMSDRLLNHAEPGVQRAGNAVVRSIERATALLAGSRDLMAPPEAPKPASAAPDLPSPPAS